MKRMVHVYTTACNITGYSPFRHPNPGAPNLLNRILGSMNCDHQLHPLTAEPADLRNIEEWLGLLLVRQPDDVLLFIDIPRMQEVANLIQPELKRLPDTTIVMVGSPLVLGCAGRGGDPEGKHAKAALERAFNRARRPPGLYAGDHRICQSWSTVTPVIQLYAHTAH